MVSIKRLFLVYLILGSPAPPPQVLKKMVDVLPCFVENQFIYQQAMRETIVDILFPIY